MISSSWSKSYVGGDVIVKGAVGRQIAPQELSVTLDGRGGVLQIVGRDRQQMRALGLRGGACV